MRRRPGVFLVPIAIAAASCVTFQSRPRVSSGPRPDWVGGSSLRYPGGFYLTGVGLGDDRNSAEALARAEIAKIFSSRVTVQEGSAESEATRTTNGRSEKSFSQSVSQSVQVASDQVLKDVKIAADWQDSATGQYYALAVMDRQKTSAALEDEIAGLDRQAAGFEASLNSAADKFSKARAALKTAALLKARGALARELRVASVTGQVPRSPVDQAAVEAQAAAALSALDVSVSISGDGSGAVLTGIVSGLNEIGIAASADSASPDIAVKGQLTSAVLTGRPPPWRWARATLVVSMEDVRAGKIFSRFDLTDREASSVGDEEAIERADLALGKKVSAAVKDAVSAYFENL